MKKHGNTGKVPWNKDKGALPLTFNCKNCGVLKDTSHRNTNTYCSHKCQKVYENKVRIINWKETGKIGHTVVKKYLINQKNECWRCGIIEWQNKPITLELDHINGNSDDNQENNLQILCPNCHSQTPTYKGKNMGNGRYIRRQRHRDGKSY